MNAERLHAIVNDLLDEMKEQGLPSMITELRDELRQTVNEPGNPNPQQRLSALRQQLNDVLREARSNGYSPVWREVLKEMGIDGLIGSSLRTQVETIFETNAITPSTAVDQLDPLVERVTALFAALSETQSGLSFLEIGAEELEPGEVEIGFLIPRGYVEEELDRLGREFIELERILRPFIEVATGTHEPVKVRAISSSGFAAFLHSAPAVALVVASAADRLIAAYKNVLEIKELRNKAKNAGASQKSLKALQADAEGSMEKAIGQLVTALMKQAKVTNPERQRELETALRVSANALANRIDAGFSVEVRVGELPPPPDTAEGENHESKADAELRRTIEQVREKQERITFVNTTGEQILSLPESTTGSPTRKPTGTRKRAAKHPPAKKVGF